MRKQSILEVPRISTSVYKLPRLLPLMRIFDFLALLIMVLALIGGIYFFWLNFPVNLEYNTYVANATAHLPAQSYQFYPNMRYVNKTITYEIAPECSAKKRENIGSAFSILEQQTSLSFIPVGRKGEIVFFCTNLPPDPESSGHFVAGEGGPTQIVNTTQYAVILAGKVSLYRPEKCGQPIIALHEILHALGFDHTSDKRSIMFPITDCEQEVDPFIINQINALYEPEPRPDLAIERVDAKALGRYLNFEISVANYGLVDAQNATLILSTGSEYIKSFPMEDIGLGQRKTLTVSNVRIPRAVGNLSFTMVVGPGESELSLANNHALVELQAA